MEKKHKQIAENKVEILHLHQRQASAGAIGGGMGALEKKLLLKQQEKGTKIIIIDP
ncbi:hypothetical protein ABEV55_08450 [Aneurinibacillus thermoaerophilus]|uniref:hypothetical protein n=1 Tax=Aneurinibacillus thermoaerophilus TaxID=143495 RepID=UPI002E1E2BFB|nr:hypothetical protein [Aneurinibacillus thermoaerophilus]